MLIVSDHPRERGVATNDITSYLASQKEWGPNRDRDWPKIQDNVLHRFERQGYPIPDYKPEIWYDAGRIVLDPDNHAILKYKIIPATLSSELSGRDMEAMKRLDLRITRKDFRARMPRTVLSRGKGKSEIRKPLYTLSAIGMRTTRFRTENGLSSWTNREGSNNIRRYMSKRMPQANIDANSTEGMSLPTLFEQEDSRASNKGKFLNRAGGRALPNDVREEMAQKENSRLQKLRTAHIEAGHQIAGDESAKRRREHDGESEPDEETRPIKRSRGNGPLQPQSHLNAAPSLQLMSCPRDPSQHENSTIFVLSPAGNKRSHEEFSSDDEDNLERPSKRQHSQMVPIQLPRHTAGEIKSRNRAPTSGRAGNCVPRAPCIRTQPNPNPIPLVEESRVDDSIFLNMGGSITQEAQLAESWLEAEFGAWSAQQQKETTNFTPAGTEIEGTSSTEDLNFLDTAPTCIQNSNQDSGFLVDFGSFPDNFADLDFLIIIEDSDFTVPEATLTATVQEQSILSEKPSKSPAVEQEKEDDGDEPEHDLQRSILVLPIQSQETQSEQEHDLFSLIDFGEE